MDEQVFVLEYVAGDWSVDIPVVAGVFDTLEDAQRAVEEAEPLRLWLPMNDAPHVLQAKSDGGPWSFWRVYPLFPNVLYIPEGVQGVRRG